MTALAYGPHSDQVSAFIAWIATVKGDHGYGDHRIERDADDAWAFDVEPLIRANPFIDAANDALAESGHHSERAYRALCAIIVQDSIPDELLELIYQPFQLQIPFASLSAPEPVKPKPTIRYDARLSDEARYVADGYAERYERLGRAFAETAQGNPPQSFERAYFDGMTKAYAVIAEELRDDSRRRAARFDGQHPQPRKAAA